MSDDEYAARASVRETWSLLPAKRRRRFVLLVLTQMAVSLLDLAGVALIAFVGVMFGSAIQGEAYPDWVTNFIEAMGLGGVRPVFLAVAIGACAALLLVIKSIASLALMSRVYRFLASVQSEMSVELSQCLFSMPLERVEASSSQRQAYAVVGGPAALSMGVLGAFSVILSEAALLLLLTIALLAASPVLTLSVIIFFALISLAPQRLLGRRSHEAGRLQVTSSVNATETVQDALRANREIKVAGMASTFPRRLSPLFEAYASGLASVSILGLIPKAILEIGLVLGGLGVVLWVANTESLSAGLGTLLLYLAAGSRMVPSLLRISSQAITLRSSSQAAAPSLTLAQEPREDDLEVALPTDGPLRLRGTSLSLRHVAYRYPNTTFPALSEVNLSIPQGAYVALVGHSGSGKTTLADLMVGLRNPEHGTVRIDGIEAREYLKHHHHDLSYVPQRVAIMRGTIRDNVVFGAGTESDDSRVWEALQTASLADRVRRLPDGLDTALGEFGIGLSGGELQRLGLARVFYRRSRLVILDEPTSALDRKSEAAVLAGIKSLVGHATLVVVAHRIETVRSASMVVALEGGRAQVFETFSAWRAAGGQDESLQGPMGDRSY